MLESINRQGDAVEALVNDRVMARFDDIRRPTMFGHWSEVFDLLHVPNIATVLKPADNATKMVSLD